MKIISLYYNHGAGIAIYDNGEYYTVELGKFVNEKYKGFF